MRKSESIITTKHYLIWAVIAFAAGIIFATSIPSVLLSASIRIMTTALIITFAAMIFTIPFRNTISGKPFLFTMFLILMALAGCTRILSEESYSSNSLKTHQDTTVWLTGTVKSTPALTRKGFSYYFEMEVFQINDISVEPENIMLYIPRERGAQLKQGDQICCWTKINKPDSDSQHNPYSYENNLRGRNIYFTGTIKNANPAQFSQPFSIISAIKNCGETISNAVTSAIDQVNITQTVESTILKGILVGDKSDFSDELYEQFSFAGLSHIVAVSGMHLSILFSVIMLILGTLKIRKRILLLLAIPPVILFAATAKFTPSVCRASIMILMMLTATIAGKRYSSVNALFLSLGIILAVSPYAVYSISLTLSFGATLGILAYNKYISHFLKKLIHLAETKSAVCNNILSTVLGFISASLSISLSVTIATAYFSLMFFDSLSWIQLFTNIWIIPTVTVVFCLGYLVSILWYIFPPIAELINYPLSFFLSIISKTAEIFGQKQFTFQIPENSLKGVYLLIYISLAILLYHVLKTAFDLSERNKLSTDARRRTKPGIPRL